MNSFMTQASQIDEQNLGSGKIDFDQLDGELESLDATYRRLIEDEQELSQTRQHTEKKLRAVEAELQEMESQRTTVADQIRQLDERRQHLRQQQRHVLGERERVRALFRQLDSDQEATAGTVQLASEGIASAPARDERRAHPRIPLTVDVSFGSAHNFYTGLTENISEGGLFIATYDTLPQGTQFDLTINLPAHSAIEARGEVCWVREYSPFTEDLSPGIGVRFIDLDEKEQGVIADFLRKRSPMLYE